MKIFFGTIFFAFAVFFNSIALSSEAYSERRRFPYFQRRLEPSPFRTFPYQPAPYFDVLRKLEIHRGFVPLDVHTTLVAKGDTVIGWEKDGSIRPLYDQEFNMVIHNLNNHVTVPKRHEELFALGVLHPLPRNTAYYPEFPVPRSASPRRLQ